MDVKILGSGCVNCRNLESLTRDALRDLGLDVQIDEVTDPAEIAAWGVMSTPALVIDDEVVVAGHIPSPAKLTELVAARRTP